MSEHYIDSIMHGATINVATCLIGVTFNLLSSDTTRLPCVKVIYWKQKSVHCQMYALRLLIKNESFSQTHLYLFYFIIKLATCFDPKGSSSGLHYEPTFLKSCVHSWYPKQCLEYNVWNPKNVSSFLNKLVHNEGLMMTPSGRNMPPVKL